MLAKLNGRIVTPNEPQNEHQNEPQNALQKRLEAVAAMILANGSIAISVIAQNLNVSRDSIKRDLKNLATLGKAHRKMVVGFANCGLDHRSIKDYI